VPNDFGPSQERVSFAFRMIVQGSVFVWLSCTPGGFLSEARSGFGVWIRRTSAARNVAGVLVTLEVSRKLEGFEAWVGEVDALLRVWGRGGEEDRLEQKCCLGEGWEDVYPGHGVSESQFCGFEA